MVFKTLIYNSDNYANNEETYIFKMQKKILIYGLILDFIIYNKDTMLKIGLGQNLYQIPLELGEGYIPLDLLHNFKLDTEEPEIFTIEKSNFGQNDKVILKIILQID